MQVFLRLFFALGGGLSRTWTKHDLRRMFVHHVDPVCTWRYEDHSNVEVRDSPARDICSLHVVLQGSHQMGRVLGTPSPPPPSPTPGRSGRHSGWGTIFGVCPYGNGLRWDISGHAYRGFAQNFDTFHMGIVVWPGEHFLKKSSQIEKMRCLRKLACLKIQNIQISRKKKTPEANVGSAARSF